LKQTKALNPQSKIEQNQGGDCNHLQKIFSGIEFTLFGSSKYFVTNFLIFGYKDSNRLQVTELNVFYCENYRPLLSPLVSPSILFSRRSPPSINPTQQQTPIAPSVTWIEHTVDVIGPTAPEAMHCFYELTMWCVMNRNRLSLFLFITQELEQHQGFQASHDKSW